MYELTKYLGASLRDALFPHQCVCGKWGTILCNECSSGLVSTKTEVCPSCKRISKYGKVCDGCRPRSALTGVMVVGPHQGVLKSLIWKLKYGPIRDAALPLSDVLVHKYSNFLRVKMPVITYVPTSRERQRLRGYNQAEVLALSLAKRCNLDLVTTLARPKDVLHQVGLTRKERIENAVGTVEFCGVTPGTNKKIVVIDDVYTTGATLEECAKVLRANGYREVWGMVLSRD